MIRAIFIIITLIALSGCAKTIVDSNGATPQFSIYEHTLSGKKSPTIIIAHPCSGISGNNLTRWARTLNEWGYNAILVDSFSDRGESNICNRQKSNVTQLDRASDIIKTARWIQDQPWHQGKIGAIGFSNGATTMLLLDNKQRLISEKIVQRDESINLSALVAYYPGCNFHLVENPEIPILLQLGVKDEWTPSEKCIAWAKTHPQYEAKIYPNAGHAFDMYAPPRTYMGHYLSYDEDADKEARASTKAFFDKHLR